MTATVEHVNAGPTATQPVTCAFVAEDETRTSKHRTIRMEDDLWRDLDPAAAAIGMDRSSVLRQFARWFTHVPGAQLPQRPEPREK